jgi:hypothetical protein
MRADHHGAGEAAPGAEPTDDVLDGLLLLDELDAQCNIACAIQCAVRDITLNDGDRDSGVALRIDA